MSLYNDHTKSGELWFRSVDGTINSSNISLSAIAEKYKSIDFFYDDLIKNEITRFDIFYDCLFLETINGYIFEKIIFNDNLIIPYQNNNNFTQRSYTPVNYWFDEINFKIYFVEIRYTIQNQDIFDFYLILNEFDCHTGNIDTVYKHYIKLSIQGATYFNSNSQNWGNDIPIIEKPQICYNKDTKMFNVSFIVRNNNTNTFGLMSINIKKSRQYITQDINGLIPFCNSCELITDQNVL